ncbi:MAG: VTT domain-containing protein [Pseudomonadota bacterium]
MDNIHAYMQLFNDSLYTSLMFVPKTPYVAETMSMLGVYNPYIILIVSFIANMIGVTLNWVLGMFARKLENLRSFSHRVNSLKKAEDFFGRKGKWVLLFSFVPLWGALLTTAAGVLNYRYFHFFILVSFSKFIGLAIDIFF